MEESDFEGSLVLEQLMSHGLLEEFWRAVDHDNLIRARELLIAAEVDRQTLDLVLQKMREGGPA